MIIKKKNQPNKTNKPQPKAMTHTGYQIAVCRPVTTFSIRENCNWEMETQKVFIQAKL